MDKKSRNKLSRQKLKRENKRRIFKISLIKKHKKRKISKKVAVARSEKVKSVGSENQVFDRKAWNVGTQ